MDSLRVGRVGLAASFSACNAPKVLAIDIGGSKALCGLVDEQGRVLRRFGAPVPYGMGANALMALVIDCAAKALGDDTAHAIGVNIPGLADVAAGQWVYAPFSGISRLPVGEILRERFGVPVRVENDVNACALAEMRFGCCASVGDFLWVTVSNGVGGAVVMDGSLRRGAMGNAGEIGHLIVEERPEAALSCGCGRAGCLEAMAAGPGIAARYGEPGVDAEKVARHAGLGEQKAIFVMEETGRYLGVGLAAAATILNPALIVLGGGVAQSLNLFAGAMREEFEKRVFRQGNSGVEIRATALGYDAALLGAATVALEGGRANGA